MDTLILVYLLVSLLFAAPALVNILPSLLDALIFGLTWPWQLLKLLFR